MRGSHYANILRLFENFLGFRLQDEHNASLKFNMCAGGISTAQRQRYEKFLEGGCVFLEKSVVIFWRFEMFFVCLHLERRSFRGAVMWEVKFFEMRS